MRAFLVQLSQRYAAASEFTEASTEPSFAPSPTKTGIKAGPLINGSRVALTGQAVAPSLFAVMVDLGKNRVVKRLAAANNVGTELRIAAHRFFVTLTLT